ncbi:MAG: glycosyltransferase family 2 protein [Magnetococcales bacterium]|nr:glycosyltransferase family 2 protein [Magnetococcales bacterium]
MNNHPSSAPILLSICIPTYNRQRQLAHALESLRWTLDVGFPVEITVSNNASTDETERVALEKGALFPHFRYARQHRTVEADINIIAAMRLASGKYCIWMADDDYLIPANLLAEIEYLNQHEDIIVSHASPQMWNDVTQTECGLVYPLEEAVEFSRIQSAELFNFIFAKRVFPEWGLYRTEQYMKVLFEPHALYFPFVWTFRALAYGRVRFHTTPNYRVVLHNALKHQDLNQENQGLVQVKTFMDKYRGGMEFAASMALCAAGLAEFNPDNRSVVLDMINDFVVGRISVAARIAQHHGNFIAASEFLRRQLLWAKTEADRAMIRQLEEEVVAGAAVQAVGELFGITAGAKRLVLCEMADPTGIQFRFHQLAPNVPTAICSVSVALCETDRQDCLYLTEQEAVRQALRASGVPIGKIVLYSEAVAMFRITA